ncbi:MAG TPA: hypothetical protein VHU83_17905 [Bryobacteraceae bacterium]|jgi:hypothetical protein|nr:hypothetical protein [Bryobacteraceae bacterium]
MNGDRSYTEPRFLFHAEALGLAAHIRQPKEYFLDSVASSTLAITGGRAQARVGPGAAGIISYQSAATHVCGDFVPFEETGRFTSAHHGKNGLPARTGVQVTVTGFKLDVPQQNSWFNLFGRSSRTFSIEHAEVMLGSISDRQRPNAYKTLNAVMRGVFVDGRELNVDIDTQLFTENCTKRKLDCALDDEGFRERCSNQILHEMPGSTLATVVTGLRWADGPALHTNIDRNKLTIEGLGSLYFGEIVIEEGFRRFTLLRFELGSRDEGQSRAEEDARARFRADDSTSGDTTSTSTTGTGTMGQADSNGQTSPPQKTMGGS